MPDDVRYVTGGAILGAVVGALGAWMYVRFLKPQGGEPDSGRKRGRVERGQLVRLGWAVIGIVRQILELG